MGLHTVVVVEVVFAGIVAAVHEVEDDVNEWLFSVTKQTEVVESVIHHLEDANTLVEITLYTVS